MGELTSSDDAGPATGILVGDHYDGGIVIMLRDRKTVLEFYSALIAADVKGVAQDVVSQIFGILSR